MQTNLMQIVSELTDSLKPWTDRESDEYRCYYISPCSRQQAYGRYAHVGMLVRHKANMNIFRRATNIANTLNHELAYILPDEPTARLRGLVMQVIDQETKDKTWKKIKGIFVRVDRAEPIKVSSVSYQPILNISGEASGKNVIVPSPIYASPNGITVLHNNPYYVEQTKKLFERHREFADVEYIQVPWLSSRIGKKAKLQKNTSDE